MGALDRLAGPDGWDDYCEMRERLYDELIEGKSCLDCGRVEKCDRVGHEGVGWCLERGEFVTGEDSVRELKLECFEEAA